MGDAYTKVVTKANNPYLEGLKDDMAARKDKDFFWPTGTQVYCGRQGSGKTISCVKHLIDLKKRYPKCIIVSNIRIKTLNGKRFDTKEELQGAIHRLVREREYIYYETMAQLTLALTNVNNDRLGVIYVVDEIHTYFNALESKNIPMYVFTEISQQRKQRKLIIGTSQLFLRMAKPFREQCDNLIICNTIMGFFTMQKAYDGMTLVQDFDGSLSGNLKKIGWFFHTRKIRKSFDTYQKVVSGQEQYEQTMNLTQSGKKPQIVVKNR